MSGSRKIIAVSAIVWLAGCSSATQTSTEAEFPGTSTAASAIANDSEETIEEVLDSEEVKRTRQVLGGRLEDIAFESLPSDLSEFATPTSRIVVGTVGDILDSGATSSQVNLVIDVERVVAQAGEQTGSETVTVGVFRPLDNELADYEGFRRVGRAVFFVDESPVISDVDGIVFESVLVGILDNDEIVAFPFVPAGLLGTATRQQPLTAVVRDNWAAS